MDMIKKNSPNKYLLLVDVFSLILSFILTAWVRYGNITKDWYNINIYGGAFIIVLLLYIVLYYLYDTYSKLFKRGFIEEIIVVTKLNGILAFTLTAIMFVFQGGTYYSRLFFFCFFLLLK
jgi:FlaA1/EpsC-like NDP-sugar epimerase